MTYRPEEEEKLKALDELFYEIEQLLGTMGPKTGKREVDNARLESRLIHVRNLLDFFAHQRRDRDDVLASHFGFPFSPVSIDRLFADRLNKDLAHLTYSRTSRSEFQRGWPAAQVVVPTLSRCKEFINYILADRNIFAAVGPARWRALGLRIQAFLESPLARQGV